MTAIIIIFFFIALIIWGTHLAGLALDIDARTVELDEKAQELADWEADLAARERKYWGGE